MFHGQNLFNGVLDYGLALSNGEQNGDTDTNGAICGALLGAVHGRTTVPRQWQRMILSCRAAPGLSRARTPRPALFWPTDALVLAERLLGEHKQGSLRT